MIPIALPAASSPERLRILRGRAIQSQSLDDLYQRREAVNRLIDSLEQYVQSKPCRRAELIPLNATRMCS